MGAALNLPRACFEGVFGASRTAPPALRESACKGFSEAFGEVPVALGVAPGRAEVLGNHTDYNEGFILSCAVDKFVVIAGRARDGTEARIISSAFVDRPRKGLVSFSVTSPQKQSGDSAWANYVAGVVSELVKLQVKVGGFDAFVTTNVPLGAGISSSAAIEMATAKLLARLFPNEVGKLDDLALIKACKAAENNFVGMGCGILDQFSSGRGQAGHLLHLDCRDLSYGYAPFRGGQFVLANTNAPHQLVDGQYDELRRQCFAAAESLKKESRKESVTHLRDLDVAVFEEHASKLPEAQRKRAKHIIYENERVQTGIKALKDGDMALLGQLMSQSHASSRDDFGNSCKELDIMVECSKGIDGWLGSRLMGGGFGGCTINLVSFGFAETFAAELTRKYQANTGIQPTIVICEPADGAFSEHLS